MAARPAHDLHLRVSLSPRVAFGPGKASLLESVAKTGSISAAAKALRMSYRRAWLLLDELNHDFREPLVEKTKGGKGGGGGAQLTPAGAAVVELYRTIESRSLKASAPSIAKLRDLLAARA